MKIVVAADADEAARIVATTLVDSILDCDRLVLGLAAGRSPERSYELIARRQPPIGELSVVMLDEYLGVGRAEPQSFCHYIRSRLTDGLGLDPSRLHTLDGLAGDPVEECRQFETAIVGLGGVGLQLLGLGRNGHIGFNEPGSGHDSRTRPVRLSETTRRDNAPAFASRDAVPTHALTQGIATILEARRILLLAVGPHKSEAVAAALEGPVSEAVPASALQRHDDITVVLDRAAASGLSESP